MNAQRFRTFSFVDQIFQASCPGRVTGTFLIGSHLQSFPQALVAEAIGQLAAWASMSHLDFKYRPVAALAGETLYFADANPGDVLSLNVNIDSCDRDFVSYSGEAKSGQNLVLRLNQCSGAMLPQEEFDSPESIRQDYQTLCSSGAQPGRLQQLPSVLPTPHRRHPDGSIESDLNVPAEADFFGDHFPRKPVFPATLLMHALSSMLIEAIATLPPTPGTAACRLKALRRVKVRSWIHPGAQVCLRAEGLVASNDNQLIKLSARVGGKLVATATADVGVAAGADT